MNLAARFPEDLVIPDLGPKMYNAHASDDGFGGKGRRGYILISRMRYGFLGKFVSLMIRLIL